MGIPSGVSNATKTGFYLILLVMGLTVMGYTVERCIVVDDDNTALECSKRAHAVLSLGTISAAFLPPPRRHILLGRRRPPQGGTPRRAPPRRPVGGRRLARLLPAHPDYQAGRGGDQLL
eukprot:TRINITY_DN47_c0_g1_i7.p3 TRINITY_DN47_c0_g1~~TRINITY_DN47_c0_g1_i7.p3  ORF type:complete len:119 (+),score=26.47 TRINITY_DN47_c0_g1_i7:427-783(+)